MRASYQVSYFGLYNVFQNTPAPASTDVTPAILTRDSDARQSAQNRAALYSENESRDCATRHDATCDTSRHTCDFDLSRVKVARLCRRCDIGLTLTRTHLSHTGNDTVPISL